MSIAAIACGSKSKSTPISPPPIGTAPHIVCPADQSATIHGGSTALTFSAPVLTGGNEPVAVTCAPSSGGAFKLGSTTVSCVATDAAGLSASCSFNVRVAGVQLGIKRIEAIGDSLTEGENGLPLQVKFTDDANSYPTKLRALLESDFPGQGLVVSNRGAGGQRFDHMPEDKGTLDLLPAYLASDMPEAVLIVGGYNHLTTPCDLGAHAADDPVCSVAVELAEDALRDVIRVAKSFPTVRWVFVATMTPAGPVAADAPRDLRIDPSAIADMNDRIRNSVAHEGAILVDVFPAFLGHEAEYISVDGLHLRPAGYQKIAELFYEKILQVVPQSNPARIR